MKERLEANSGDETVKDLVHLLFETALLVSGFSLEEPSGFGSRIFKMVKMGLGVDTEEDIVDADVVMPEAQPVLEPVADTKMEEVD
jgi:molecular chaperone HtpG